MRRVLLFSVPFISSKNKTLSLCFETWHPRWHLLPKPPLICASHTLSASLLNPTTYALPPRFVTVSSVLSLFILGRNLYLYLTLTLAFHFSYNNVPNYTPHFFKYVSSIAIKTINTSHFVLFILLLHVQPGNTLLCTRVKAQLNEVNTLFPSLLHYVFRIYVCS